jgi:hypothetical protein
MDVQYAPRRQVRAWLQAGWRLVPGHEYSPDDYAIMMVRPEIETAVTAKWINTVAKRFETEPQHRSNRSTGATSRNRVRYGSVERA